jgi:hypothetical protein
LGASEGLHQVGVVGDDHAQKIPGIKVFAAESGRIARIANQIMNLGQSVCFSILSQEGADADDVEAAATGARLSEHTVANIFLLSTHALGFDAWILFHEALEQLRHLALLEGPGVGESAFLLGSFVKNLVKLTRWQLRQVCVKLAGSFPAAGQLDRA